ncbi:MAG TPA: hypothetical protein V6C58_14880 [Allocoleopsis sp.]
MASQVCPANFNLATQCPQMYIYILAIITSALLSVRFGNYNQVIGTLVMGGIMTFILMGINFCSWNFQWVTWIFATLALLLVVGNTALIFADSKTLESIKKLEEES